MKALSAEEALDDHAVMYPRPSRRSSVCVQTSKGWGASGTSSGEKRRAAASSGDERR